MGYSMFTKHYFGFISSLIILVTLLGCKPKENSGSETDTVVSSDPNNNRVVLFHTRFRSNNQDVACYYQGSTVASARAITRQAVPVLAVATRVGGELSDQIGTTLDTITSVTGAVGTCSAGLNPACIMGIVNAIRSVNNAAQPVGAVYSVFNNLDNNGREVPLPYNQFQLITSAITRAHNVSSLAGVSCPSSGTTAQSAVAVDTARADRCVATCRANAGGNACNAVFSEITTCVQNRGGNACYTSRGC
jgi:hypothetical protein